MVRERPSGLRARKLSMKHVRMLNWLSLEWQSHLTKAVFSQIDSEAQAVVSECGASIMTLGVTYWFINCNLRRNLPICRFCNLGFDVMP